MSLDQTQRIPRLMRQPTMGSRLDRYEVLTQLAVGGMATVYIARVQGVAGFERVVAIKTLHPHFAYEEEFISMFLDEARLAARIRDSNVVSTLDVNLSDEFGYYLVMEYVEGDHFGSLIRAAAQERKRLPPPIACQIVRDVLKGLGAAHQLTDKNNVSLNLVHRDVSPHNILVGTDGIARLTDFGVAKAEVRLSSTREGQFKGKLAYMAPEQAARGQCDQRADLFSMGTVLWESLTGRRLFRGENNAETLNRILHDPIPRPSDCSPSLKHFDPLLEQALHRDPDLRFQSAAEFVRALDDCLETHRISIASTRDVAAVVNNYAAEKLALEAERIRTAVDLLENHQVNDGSFSYPTFTPSSQEGQATAPFSDPPASPEEDVTRMDNVRSLRAQRRSQQRQRWVKVSLVASIIAGIAGGLGWYLWPTSQKIEERIPQVANNTSQAKPDTKLPSLTNDTAPDTANDTGTSSQNTPPDPITDNPPATASPTKDKKRPARQRRRRPRPSNPDVLPNPYRD